MRRILALAWLLALGGRAVAGGDFQFTWVDAQGNPLPLRKVYLYPDEQTRNALSAGGNTTLDRITSGTATNGSVVVSNLTGGNYRSEFVGTYTITTNWYSLPDTNGFQYASNFVQNPTIYKGIPVYSAPVMDQKLKNLQAQIAAGGGNSNALTNGYSGTAGVNSLVVTGAVSAASLSVQAGNVSAQQFIGGGIGLINVSSTNVAYFYCVTNLGQVTVIGSHSNLMNGTWSSNSITVNNGNAGGLFGLPNNQMPTYTNPAAPGARMYYDADNVWGGSSWVVTNSLGQLVEACIPPDAHYPLGPFDGVNFGWTYSDLSAFDPAANSWFASNLLTAPIIVGTASNSVILAPGTKVPAQNIFGAIQPSLLPNTSTLTNSAATLTNLPGMGIFHSFYRAPRLHLNTFFAYGISGVSASNTIAESICMNTNGFVTNGFSMVVIDDGWSSNSRPAGRITGNPRFPDMPGLANAILTNGLQPIIYTSISGSDCGGGGVGSDIASIYQDTSDFISWGFRGVKFDKCNMFSDPQPKWDQYMRIYAQSVMDGLVFQGDSLSRPDQFWWTEFAMVNATVDQSGNTVYLNPYIWDVVNQYEAVWEADYVFADTSAAGFKSLLDFCHRSKALNFMTGPGRCASRIDLSFSNWGANPRATNIINAACILPCEVDLDSALEAMKYEPAWFTNNSEVWAVHQDQLVVPYSVVSSNANTEIWSRPLSSGAKLVGLVNKSTSVQSVTATYKMMHDTGDAIYTVRDLWGQTNMLTNAASFTLSVPTNSIWLLKVKVQ